MCIVLLTTAHPDYALIVIDNRDEFILRPTSRPHWWTGGKDENGAEPGNDKKNILSSRDLQRPEHGTWLGITKAGHFSVLTNFREDAPSDARPIAGQRSRGGMVTAWLTADPAESTEHFVARMLDGQSVKGVGGFSLICGKLRRSCFDETQSKTTSALAVMSNRADELAQVPWIGGRRGEVYGLSNASYDEPDVWPKVQDGRALLQKLVATPPASEDELREGLFSILDRDTLPQSPGLSFEEQIPLLKNSIFIPAIGDEAHQDSMRQAAARGPREARADVEPEVAHDAVTSATNGATTDADAELAKEERPDASMGFMTGLYGTQRQTVVLVDWEGRVSFTERALWDANGNPLPKGQGDAHFEFQIEGWNDDVVSNGVHQ